MQILNSLNILWKLTVRNKIVLVLFLGSIFYNIYLFYSFLFVYFEPGQTLVKSSFTVQGGILAFIIIGIQLGKMDPEEIMSVIKNAMYYKSIGKFLFILNLIALYILINLGILILMFVVSGIPFSSFYLKTVYYFVLYWGMSFLIGALIGYFLSLIIKGRMIYILSLIVWVFISPLNYPFVTQLGILLNLENNFELINILNIGQNNPHSPYNYFYGLALEPYQWLKRGFFILVILVLIMLRFAIKFPRVKANVIIAALLLFSLWPVSASLTSGSQVLHYDREKNSIQKQDYEYYKGVTSIERYKNHFQAEKYRISLNTDGKIKAEVLLEAKNTSETESDTLHFLLYHELKIESVTAEGDIRVEAIQAKDQLTVSTSRPIKPDEIVQLNFVYSGVSSPFFFANNQAVYLPNHYPWYPVLNESQTVMLDVDFQAFRLPLQPSNEITYQLNVKEGPKLFSNLEKAGHDRWEGKTSEGIYLVGGSLDEKTIGNFSIVYPLTWENILPNMNVTIAEIQKSINQIEEELGLERDHFDRVMLLKQSLSSDLPEQQAWMHGGSLIMSPDEYIYHDKEEYYFNRAYFHYALIPAITWKHEGIVNDDLKTLQLFGYSYAYFLNSRSTNIDNRASLEYFDYFISFSEETGDVELSEKAQILKEYIENNNINENEKIEFYKKWYEKIKEEDNGFIEDELNSLREVGMNE